VINAEEALPFALPAGVKTEPVPPGKTVAALLLEGQLDAVLLPHPPSSIIANRAQLRRLFADPRQAELR